MSQVLLPRAIAVLFLIMVYSFRIDALYEEELRQASIYREAGLTDKAISIYEQLQANITKNYPRAIIQYDIGTLYLQMGHWKRAVELLGSLEGDANISPLLLRRSRRNLSLAYYYWALEILEKPTEQNTETALKYLIQSLSTLELEQKADCSLELLLKYPECTQSTSYNRLEAAIKGKTALTEELLYAHEYQGSLLTNLLPILYDALSDLKEETIALKDSNSQENLKKKYSQLLTKEQQSWVPLWNDAHNKMQSESDLAKQYFSEAMQQRNNAILQINNENISKATTSIEESQSSLTSLLRALFGDKPLHFWLQRILGMYDRISERQDLTEDLINRLEAEYLRLDTNKEKNPLEIAKQILASSENLKKSLKYVKEENQDAARLLLNEAQENIQQALFLLKAPTVITQLKRMISQQQYSIDVGHRLSIMSLNENSPELMTIGFRSQEDVLKSNSPFWELLKVQQEASYIHEHHCQHSPWAKALPEIDKGFRNAKNSLIALKDSSTDYTASIMLQQSALESFKNALESIENPTPNDSGDCNGADNQTSSSANQTKAPQGQVLQNLQQMFLDDSSSAPPQKAVEAGSKPW